MKRSRLIVLTMAGVSLGSTGCRRDASRVSSDQRESTPILNPTALNAQLRQSLPAYQPGVSAAGTQIPHNAYDPSLGYYHQPCSAWFPYPYDYHDARWGWYRCGKWSRHSASTLTATAVATPTIDRTLSRLQSPIILSSLQGLRSMKACLRVRQSAFVRKMRVVHGFTLLGGFHCLSGWLWQHRSFLRWLFFILFRILSSHETSGS